MASFDSGRGYAIQPWSYELKRARCFVSDHIDLMRDLAREAGRIQLDGLGKRHEIEYKGVINIVTEIDKKCESLIVGELQAKYPNYDVIAEEGSGKRSDSGYRWIVDPLDGTVNYAHSFPFFCVSIGLESEGELIAGVIYDPNRDEMFEAEKGRGALQNGEAISVSNHAPLKEAMLATGFAYNVQEGEQLDNLNHFCSFIKTARAVRRPGSAAIDLAWVACGRLDGFWELFLKPWDMAAGVLIIREAGGSVTAFDGSEYDLYGTQILASNGQIHNEMGEVLKGTRSG